MYLYKGAGPGTHWWVTDAQTAAGFVVGHAPRNVNAIIRHIVNYSWPSPYSSFSASFAAAAAYALVGPSGKATPEVPGWVYEIDVALAIELGARFLDPAREILAQNPPIGAPGTIPTFHDGGQDLILGIAVPSLHRKVLLTPPRQPGPVRYVRPGGPPVVHNELRAVIFALRDAEVLATTDVPAACITARYPVD
jgi:hypothetical protein